ncbi:microtubule-associated protein RP/EB family member 1-like [Argopecten irradians]|uniref:microtubule-associated protein RP/EB family member 1-like n=1 Tax=Argopecten irradians TaxID=31199 RepID=UPI0037179234
MALNVYDTGNKADNVSRKELLTWVNTKLEGTYDRIEDMCTGAAYCQFMDILYPGVVNLKRVLFTTNLEHEFIRNFKLLQTAFTELGITKDIPVARLVKGKFQDNYDFLVWFKKFFDANDDDRVYNASEARFGLSLGSETSRSSTDILLRAEAKSRSQNQANKHSGLNKAKNYSKNVQISRVVSHFESPTRMQSSMDSETDSVPTSAYMVNVHNKVRPGRVTTASSGSISLPITANSSRSNSYIKPPSTVISENVSRLKTSRNDSKTCRESHSSREQKRRTEMEELVLIGLRLEELYMTVRSMEKERDFYYGKLLKVETWCSQQKRSAARDTLEAILYSEEGEELSEDKNNSLIIEDAQDGQ